jgi:hypothetical protein
MPEENKPWETIKKDLFKSLTPERGKKKKRTGRPRTPIIGSLVKKRRTF